LAYIKAMVSVRSITAKTTTKTYSFLYYYFGSILSFCYFSYVTKLSKKIVTDQVERMKTSEKPINSV